MAENLGSKIRTLRKSYGLNLNDLAAKADISTSYLSQLERGEKEGVSADILFRIANALGTTMGALLRKNEPEQELVAGEELPAALRRLFEDKGEALGMTQADVAMLAGIRYRGHQPRTMDDWEFLYLSIRRTID
jgi:transcriptional regulator with XRE-family HTH domain